MTQNKDLELAKATVRSGGSDTFPDPGDAVTRIAAALSKVRKEGEEAMRERAVETICNCTIDWGVLSYEDKCREQIREAIRNLTIETER